MVSEAYATTLKSLFLNMCLNCRDSSIKKQIKNMSYATYSKNFELRGRLRTVLRFKVPHLVDEAGWATIRKLQQGAKRLQQYTYSEIYWLVYSEFQHDTHIQMETRKSNPTYEEMGETRIRTPYGHGASYEEILEDSALGREVSISNEETPAVLFHGTTSDKVAPIQKSGLKSMGRLHIFFADKRHDVKRGANEVIAVSVKKMKEHGIKVFESAEKGKFFTRGIMGEIPTACFVPNQLRQTNLWSNQCETTDTPTERTSRTSKKSRRERSPIVSSDDFTSSDESSVSVKIRGKPKIPKDLKKIVKDLKGSGKTIEKFTRIEVRPSGRKVVSECIFSEKKSTKKRRTMG